MDHPALATVVILLALAEAGRLLLWFIRPEPPYRVAGWPGGDLSTKEFTRKLAAITDVRAEPGNSIEVYSLGKDFYDAQLNAIRGAGSSIHLAIYLFRRGDVASRYVECLAEKAAAGVEVRVLLDSFGSLLMRKRHFRRVIDAGGRVEWYHPLRWHTWPRVNNRSHENVLILDGAAAFVGGAGVADIWLHGRGRRRAWRDTVFRVNGPAVAGIQASFAQNWVETTGELLAGNTHFPALKADGDATAIVVNSSPTRGGSTRARILYQVLLAASQRTVRITTPYFLPDASARREMSKAIKERGVEIEILVPGRRAVPFFTRRCSRRRYGELLQAGARIFEYRPAMMHVKTMVVDDLWCVFGSTNFDPRSFGINDEVNVAARDSFLAERLKRDYDADRISCVEIQYDRWAKRPLSERVTELLSAILERQQ